MSENHYVSGEKSLPGIISHCIARALLDDGILEQPIKEVLLSDGSEEIWYFTQLGYFARTSNPEAKEKLRTNGCYELSFIPQEIWKAASSSFQRHENIYESAENCILPLIKDQIDQMPEDQRCEVIRQYLIYNGILETPIRYLAGNTYYFDNEERYQIDRGSKHHEYPDHPVRGVFAPRGQAFFNLRLWTKAVSKFEEGMPLINCAKIFLNEELHQNTEPIAHKYIERLIQKIDSPQFERVPENPDPNSFDRIRVTVSLPMYLYKTWEELRDAVKKHRREIDRRVVEKIESDRAFKRYGIPLSFLRLSNLSLGRDFTLEYIFEFRDIKEDGTAK